MVQAFERSSTGGLLPNFGPGADWARIARSYDDDALHQLSALGDQDDPAGVLQVGQVVRSHRD